MKKLAVATLFIASSMFAHTALMSCFDNGDGSVTCEGGFSDGSSASGVAIKVMQDKKVVVEGKLSKDSDFTFKKPKGEYEVELNAGEGHQVNVKSKEITE